MQGDSGITSGMVLEPWQMLVLFLPLSGGSPAIKKINKDIVNTEESFVITFFSSEFRPAQLRFYQTKNYPPTCQELDK